MCHGSGELGPDGAGLLLLGAVWLRQEEVDQLLGLFDLLFYLILAQFLEPVEVLNLSLLLSLEVG